MLHCIGAVLLLNHAKYGSESASAAFLLVVYYFDAVSHKPIRLG